MTREHRRPLIAFVAVTLLCSLVVGNSMALASGSSRNLAQEVRAAVVGESPSAGSSTNAAGASLADATPSLSPPQPALSIANLWPFDPPYVQAPDSYPTSQTANEPGVVVPPDSGNSTLGESPSGPSTPSAPSDPTPSAGSDDEQETPESSPSPEPEISVEPEPEPSQEAEPTPSEDTVEVPESAPVLTFDDITNPDPPIDPNPGSDDSNDNQPSDDGQGATTVDSGGSSAGNASVDSSSSDSAPATP